MMIKIVQLVKNMSQQIIAKELGISKNSILEILLKFQSTESVLEWPKCSHLWKSLHRMVWKLMRMSTVQPKKMARQVMDECNLFNMVSVHTTYHILQEHRLKGCIAAKKPALTKKFLKKRLSWSKDYELWYAHA